MITYTALAAVMALSTPSQGLQARAVSLTQPRIATAMLECVVARDGGLGACRVASESPSDLGVGEAALAMSGHMQVDPMGPDGRLRTGETVIVPVRIQINEKAS